MIQPFLFVEHCKCIDWFLFTFLEVFLHPLIKLHIVLNLTVYLRSLFQTYISMQNYFLFLFFLNESVEWFLLKLPTKMASLSTSLTKVDVNVKVIASMLYYSCSMILVSLS